jgi:hypothetical protein
MDHYLSVKQSGITCSYGGWTESKISLFAPGEAGTEGTMAAVKDEGAELPLEAGSEFLCGGAGKLTAEYTVNEPAPLYVAEP